MNKWKKELKLIDNLGLLYPKIKTWLRYDKKDSEYFKAAWVCDLCVYELNQRIPQLEKFMKYYLQNMWLWYKEHFNIND